MEIPNKNSEKNIPTIDLKLESRIVEGKSINSRYILVETPYIIFSDKFGIRKLWTKDKWKIILWYLWKITRINWFVKQYNKRPR